MFTAFNACPHCGNHLNSEGTCPICEREQTMREEELRRAELRSTPQKLPADADMSIDRNIEG